VEIETMSVPWLVRTVHRDTPHITRAVACGIEINHSGWRCFYGLTKQLQTNTGGVTANMEWPFRRLHARIKSPLPQDSIGFEGNRHAVVMRYEARRIVRRRAGCRHACAIGVAV